MSFKKFFCVALVLLSLIPLLSACNVSDVTSMFSKPKFETQEAMYAVVNGLWQIEDFSNDSYLLIENDHIQQIDTAVFKRAVQDLVLFTFENKGLDELRELTFESTLTQLTESDVLGNTNLFVTADPHKGIITLSNGNQYTRYIVIEDNTVGIRDENEDTVTSLNKISDSADLTAEPFKNLFLHIKNYTSLPVQTLWMDARSFGSYIYACEANSIWWTLTQDTEEATIYETLEYIPTLSGTLVIQDDSVDFVKKINIDSMDPYFEPYFYIQYRPLEGKITIMDNDNTSLSLLRLIKIGAQAMSAYPGAYDDYIDLNNALAEANKSVSDGFTTITLERHGLTYTMEYTADGSWARFVILCADNITLADMLKMIPVCSRCNLEEPNTAFDPNWETGDPCLKCTGEDVRECPFCNRTYLYEGVGHCDDCIP